MLHYRFVSVVVVLIAFATTVQESRGAEQKRGAYVVKYAAAKDLAPILAKHFKGDAEIQAGPAGTSNCLLINASPAVFDEVLKVIEQLDRKPNAVAIEVFVVELPAKKADDKIQGPDEKTFSGTIEEVTERLDALSKKGQVAAVKRFQLTTLEGQPGSLLLGESKAFVMGTRVTATGIASRQITYRDLGTQIKVTPQIMPDKSVTLDLNMQDSRSRNSETASVGTDEKGNAIPAPEFLQTTLTGKVSVASGKAVLAKDTKVVSKEGQGQMLIVVGARVVESDAKRKE